MPKLKLKPKPKWSEAAVWDIRDWLGLAQLSAEAVQGVTDLVESVHHAVASLALPIGRIPRRNMRGVTGLVYRSVRGVARLANGAVAVVTPGALRLNTPRSARRNALVAALNGAVGDHLEATGNPLAIPMSLAIRGEARTSRIVVLVHGLGMHPDQWNRLGHDHGEALARDHHFTAVYLHYNTGRRVADNGQALAKLLDGLVADWPVAVEQLVLIAHSMGGLVARCACAASPQASWKMRLTHLICLGTPHQGAPLERGGQWLDSILATSPYLEPFSRIGKFRSAGIMDLRDGNITLAEVPPKPSVPIQADARNAPAWPTSQVLYVIAATTSPSADGLRSAWLGDGLVPVNSALGEHDNPQRALNVPLSRQFLLTQANHWDLLNRPEAYTALLGWLLEDRQA